MSNTGIWQDRPPSFPPDNRIPFTAAEVNEFENIDDLNIRNNERNPSKESIELDSIQRSRLFRARDSVFVRQKQRNSIVSNNFSDNESNGGSVRNVRFSANLSADTSPKGEFDNMGFEGEEEVVLRKSQNFVDINLKSNDFDDNSFDDNMNEKRDSEVTKPWDVFKTIPPPDEDESMDSDWVEFFIKCLKIFAYIFTFIVTLGCAVTSKSLILLMTSMIRANRTIEICNDNNLFEVKQPLDYEKRYKVIYGDDNPMRIAWIWCLFFAVIAPELFAFGRSFRICFFKTYQIPKFTTFLTVFVFESMNSIGISILVFLILPTMDVIKGSMMTNCICLIPGLLLLLKQGDSKSNLKQMDQNKSNDMLMKKESNKLFLFMATICQFIGLIVWPVIAYYDNCGNSWSIPLALVLISFNWWENFLNQSSNNVFVKSLLSVKKDLTKSRYFTFVLISLWKMFLIFLSMILIIYLNEDKASAEKTFTDFVTSFTADSIDIVRDKDDNSAILDSERHVMTIKDPLMPVWILLIQISATYLCYAFAKFTCKIHIQTLSFAIPVNLVVPFTVSVLWIMVELSVEDKCQICDFFNGFQYIFWFTNEKNAFNYYHNWENYVLAVMWISSLASQIIIAIHIWSATSARLASTEELFINPMYCSVLIDQSLALNRRRVNIKQNLIIEDEENLKSGFDEQLGNNIYESVNDPMTLLETIDPLESDQTVRIFVCATMWHENKEEMIQMLKAVMRLDEDQCWRRNAQNFFGLSDNITDYYEIEFNIYFDDAFDQGPSDDEDDRIINRFVKQLIETMDDAASNVHGTIVKLKRPTVVPTPYGGRLEWTLPGQNKLIAHLKDKIYIRHRKRWSQCMYMYWLLGHRIAELPISEKRKEVISMNTFILALDGDINFRPHALHLVVDLMKKNQRLGAACGRIHPIGTGPMVWYQKFEYAIGHWLQKATEHVFGCVLCSPGCFSLFRARAVMDDSVMHRYTEKPTEALHYVQYDQGEDRWLCTLMLQQGWRIEYCAASDSYTHAPEGFGEFFTQRRRWAPSTMANIMDLLGDYRQTVRKNSDISKPFIVYQAMLLLGSILSPGTIFLMIVGSMNTVLGFETKISLAINIVPILLFSIICLVIKNNDHIILVAMILSTLYALLMLGVLVGTAIEMGSVGPLTPNSIFFVGLMGSFVVAAIIHPQEFACVFPLFLYMLLIPSMYLLLTIYWVTNMHIVTWGTREVKSKLTAKEAAAQAAAAQAAAEENNQKKSLLGFLNFKESGFFTCMCCSNSRSDEESAKLLEITEKLNKVNENVVNIKSNIDSNSEPKLRRNSSLYRRKSFANQNQNNDNLSLPMSVPEEDEDEDEDDSDERSSLLQENLMTRAFVDRSMSDPTLPKWARDETFQKYPFDELSPKEREFWDLFIPKYLLPLDENPKEQERIKNDLIELRNKVVFTFAIINIIFVLFVYLLQMHKDVFGITLPAGIDYYNNTYNAEKDIHELVPIYKHVVMDPIGLVLIVFFGMILVVQVIGMFMHRFGTLAHLLAFTSIDFCKTMGTNANIKGDQNSNINGQQLVQLTRKLQKQGVNQINETDNKNSSQPMNRRQSVFAPPQTSQALDLTQAFRQRVMSLNPNSSDMPGILGVRKKSIGDAVLQRRNTVNWRRMSLAPEPFQGIKSQISNQSSRTPSISSQNYRPKSIKWESDLTPTLTPTSTSAPKLIVTPSDNKPATGQHSIAYYNLVQQNIANNLSEDIIRNSLNEYRDPQPNQVQSPVEESNQRSGVESAQGSTSSDSNKHEVSAQVHSTDSSTNSTVSSNIDFNFDTFDDSDTNDNDFPVTTFQPTVVSVSGQLDPTLATNEMLTRL